MKTVTEVDAGVPGGVYLCQVSDTVSCGACCGLYNVNVPGRTALSRLLKHRTDIFRTFGRAPADLDAFVAKVQAVESQERPFDDFHHCPFLGLVGDGQRRVGCLLHPLGHGNGGVDLRGISYYGGMACRVFFCRTVHSLEKRYKQILRVVMDDWYGFGLVVTETDFLGACMDLVETRWGAPLDPAFFNHNDAAREAMRKLLVLKMDWPFRPPHHDTPCHYLFDDNRHPRPAIDYAVMGVQPSLLDAILFQLVSAFEDATQLRRAEAMVWERIDEVVHTLDMEMDGS